jgi:hypothetical protein
MAKNLQECNLRLSLQERTHKSSYVNVSQRKTLQVREESIQYYVQL